MDRKAIAAMILGCKPQELMSYRDFGGFVSVVGPGGGKHVYTTEHLQDAAQRSMPAKPVTPAKYIEVGGLRLAVPATRNKSSEDVASAKKTAAAVRRSSKKIAKKPAARKPARSPAVKASTGK